MRKYCHVFRDGVEAKNNAGGSENISVEQQPVLRRKKAAILRRRQGTTMLLICCQKSLGTTMVLILSRHDKARQFLMSANNDGNGKTALAQRCLVFLLFV